MTHGSLFSGIGGFDLAAEWMGWTNLFHCEIDPFPQKILKHYWPDAELFTDIKTADFTAYADRIDVLTGGFPCQPYSTAGKRLGKEDDRHLWPEMLRAIREIKPRWVVGENVFGLINWSGGLVFHEVQADLEDEGYEVQPYVLPAVSINAPHRRDRIWVVAKRNASDTDSPGVQGQSTDTGTSKNIRQRGAGFAKIRHIGCAGRWENFPTESPVCGRNDGLPRQLDGITFSKWRNESIKGYGNAVVPQVVYQIFKAIQQYEDLCSTPTQSQ